MQLKIALDNIFIISIALKKAEISFETMRILYVDSTELKDNPTKSQ